MKFSLYQIESARRNPQKYGAKLLADKLSKKKGQFDARQFRTYLSVAIRQYHEMKQWPAILAEFSDTCLAKLDRIHFHDVRTRAYVKMLETYFKTFPAQRVKYIEMGKRFSLSAGVHVITGKVDRFDVHLSHGNRYRATDLSTSPRKSWRKNLRWPLIQQALAHEVGASPVEVEVGIHNFESGLPDYHIYSNAELEAALAEAEHICDEIAGAGADGDHDIDDL
jgi:hypothetical protein